ncbi:GNAT family N-acetyltransferase [Candidatus Pelagibacter sp. Uisw_092]|uniref:GNAT family N-acetyltransferase n=1 Tax=Candidatus Pelagibacter sp. Uisw_092 TaxID=3230979 RepID=UPI0039EB6E31
MTEKIYRSYLEIRSPSELKEVKKPSKDCVVQLADSKDFQLNKFFYKNIGKNCQWIDRLTWTDLNWIDYISNDQLFTYILKDKNEIAGYFELLFKKQINEVEIAYFGVLDEYFGRKLGGYLLSEAIKNSFTMGCDRVWAHTCSLDHKNALKNYLARGMKVFKSEILIR